jgi:hypothetical protein
LPKKQETFAMDHNGSLAMYSQPSSNTCTTFKATKSAAKANIDVTPSQPEATNANSNVTPSKPEITKSNIDVTPSQPEDTNANIAKTHSQPETAKVDTPAISNVTNQATKYTELQFSEATKYTEQQSSEAHSLMASTEKDSWPVSPTKSEKHSKPVSSTKFDKAPSPADGQSR